MNLHKLAELQAGLRETVCEVALAVLAIIGVSASIFGTVLLLGHLLTHHW